MHALKKKLLILGASSYVGRHLLDRVGAEKAIATFKESPIDGGVYFDALSMDLSSIVKNPEEISHAVILLGETNFRSCFLAPQRAYEVNVTSIKHIIDFLKQWKIKPIFTSSDYVFDGSKGNYSEADAPHPIISYGKHKVEVEKYIQDVFDDYIIVRLAKVVGDEMGDGTLFVNWIKEIEESKVIKCAYDQILSPIFIGDVVEGIIQLIEKNHAGIFHLCGRRSFSRLELFEMLIAISNMHVSMNVETVKCSINDLGFPEAYPLNISMTPDKILGETGLTFKDMESVCESIACSKLK